jgi:hypothetical protein
MLGKIAVVVTLLAETLLKILPFCFLYLIEQGTDFGG